MGEDAESTARVRADQSLDGTAWAYLRAVLTFMLSRRVVALIGSPSARRAGTARGVGG